MPQFHIVTSQISGEPIHRQLLINLEALADEINADIIIGANYAENCNALIRDDNPKTQWVGHPATEGYILRDRDMELEGAILKGSVNIRPKAANPLLAVRPFIADRTHGKHAIFFHPQIAVETMARAINAPRQTVYTTGSINPSSIDYYRRSVAESRAKFHHSLGFLLTYGDQVWPVYARRDGSFQVLYWAVENGKVKGAEYSHAVFGDLHAPNQDDDVLTDALQTIGTLNIHDVVLHDAIDIQHSSHHATTIRDRVFNHTDKGSLTAELNEAKRVLRRIAKHADISFIASNHHAHLDTFLEKPHQHVDAADLELYFRLNLARVQSGLSAMECWVNEVLTTGLHTMYNDFNPLLIGDILNYHGDRGICGAKGSPLSFAKGVGKAIIGHTHSELIYQGIINPGCMVKLPQGYQSGMTKSTQGMVLVDKWSKRLLLTVGQDKTFMPSI